MSPGELERSRTNNMVSVPLLSILMTTCSTLLALGMMPLLLYVYCQGFGDLQNTVPYVDIITSLFMILVPCGVGILINYYRPQYAKTITKV